MRTTYDKTLATDTLINIYNDYCRLLMFTEQQKKRIKELKKELRRRKLIK